MKTQELSWELTTLAGQMPENWHDFMEPIMEHVNQKLPRLYISNWRMVPQILLSISPDNVHAFLLSRRHVPRSLEQLFEFWKDHGGSDYYRLLEMTFQEAFNREPEEDFEREHSVEFERILRSGLLQTA